MKIFVNNKTAFTVRCSLQVQKAVDQNASTCRPQFAHRWFRYLL